MGHVQTTPDNRCAVCHRSAHRPGMGTTNHGHAYQAPAHIVISLNGKRTRLFPVVAGQ